jgi:ribosomal protein S18 acetylase RimI-like enzyme
MEQRGFAPVRYFYRMRRDLSQPIPTIQLPEGLTLRGYTPDLNRAMMQTFNETFLDHWSFEPITEKDWEMFFMQRDGFRPDLSFVVMDGAEMAAFAFNVVNAEENKLAGMAAGWVQDLGTRRPWRKRGLATALLCESMRAFKAAGLDYALLGVDSENPTGALGVYERVGFVPYKHFMALEKAIEK